MNKLTLVIRNYARPDNVKSIVAALRQQTIQPTIFLWDNSDTKTDFGADWHFWSSKNVHGSAFPYLAKCATTPFVGRLDDDLIPTDAKLLEDAVAVLEAQDDPTRIIGAYGVRLQEGKGYQHSPGYHTPSEDKWCDLIKGRLMLFNRQAIPHNYHPSSPHVDCELSFLLAGKHRHHHLVSRCFHNRLGELPAPKAYSDQNKHYEKRAEIAEQWLKSLI